MVQTAVYVVQVLVANLLLREWGLTLIISPSEINPIIDDLCEELRYLMPVNPTLVTVFHTESQFLRYIRRRDNIKTPLQWESISKYVYSRICKLEGKR